MIKTIIFDTDDVVVLKESMFSDRFSKEFAVPKERIIQFFKNEFYLCVVGKADLKEELKKYVTVWGWDRSVDDLVNYWFESENKVDRQLLQYITELRKEGIRCYLHTNNEKYRTQYLFETVGIKSFFDGAFSSAYLGYRKPQQEFWQRIYDELGKPEKSEVLVWDDDMDNVESAKTFGFNAECYTGFEEFQRRMYELFEL